MTKYDPNKITATMKLVVTAEFYDDEATEETLRYCIEQDLEDAGFEVDISLLKDPDYIKVTRCKDCKHLFDGEHTDNCCEVLMKKAGWLKEISVSPDWYCADGERRMSE